MNYKINFDATNTKGEVLQNLTLTVGPFHPEDESFVNKKKLVLQRLCVEYARLRGIKCSYANIINLQKTD